MGGQEECSAFDASNSTRIFMPFSESLLSNHEASVVESKKRKRERVTVEELLNDSFVVKPHPSTVFTKPHTLNPIALVPRMNVPLSFLDILSPSGVLPVSRLFEAHVKILELEERMGNTPVVLIARLEDGKSLFVVERVEKNICVLCKLGSWVSLSRLCAAAIVSRQQPLRAAGNRFEIRSTSQDNQIEYQVTPDSSKYNNKKRLAIEAIQSMVKRQSRDVLSTSQDQVVLRSQSGTAMESQSQGLMEVEVGQEDIVVRPMSNEILDNIRSQYFEALYLSKASLAYFAKGPLSRARATFHLDYDSTLDMNELIGFLESLILPTTVVDKKYKDGVPTLLSNLIMHEESAEEAKKTPLKVKILKNKKLKLGKNGLYSAEDTYISRWWTSHDIDDDKDAPGSKEDVIRKRVAQLRVRETQLQMIVILETLALQPLRRFSTDHGSELPSIGPVDGTSDGKTVSRTNLKKPLDLAVLIEVHIDRLCIWQSLAAEEGRIASAIEGAPNLGPKPGYLANKHNHPADILREFCIEVIVPFFSARLPEQCSVISRKLGGPIGVSPLRPKLTASASSVAAPSRSSGVTKRPISTKARRSLRRVLTDERHAREGSRGVSGAISLMRSATAPAIPGLKREGSETPLLSSIPAAEAQSMLVSRAGVMKSKKLSQREVDLSSLAHVNDAKVKKASIEAELKDAISALKRPNRQLAGQVQVEAERRAASASAKSRKSKKPVRNPSFQGVQILSTPKGNRRRDMAVDKRPTLGLELEYVHEHELIPLSSIPRVSFSARVTSTQESETTLLCEATPARPGTSETHSQCQTKSPSRLSGSSLGLGLQNQRDPPQCSPLRGRRFSKQELLDISVPFSQAIAGTPSKTTAIHATPSKQGEINTLEADAASNSLNIIIGCAGMGDSENASKSGLQRQRDDDPIYKSLGWDDYDDLA